MGKDTESAFFGTGALLERGLYRCIASGFYGRYPLVLCDCSTGLPGTYMHLPALRNAEVYALQNEH